MNQAGPLLHQLHFICGEWEDGDFHVLPDYLAYLNTGASYPASINLAVAATRALVWLISR